MSIFSYNSNHKIITALLVVGWAVFHFVGNKDAERTFENGQVRSRGGTLNAKNHGLWIWYHTNGTKKMQGRFENGKRQGVWTSWNSKGIKILECTYIDDRLEGEYITWDNSGERQKTVVYKNDKEIH
ncbi:MAG: hypothetical protein KDC83_06160 [Flavobacteriales bacterium]|nr:hypothetical protein [Flavobacteriaceae bacterium]MCB0480996.1 hypothetical protein [Flavobacteriales bacterium]